MDLEKFKIYIKAKNDFLYFCEEILGYKEDKVSGYKRFTNKHKELCRFLYSESRKSKLVLNPRYSFKSQICTVAGCLFDLVNNPNMRILIYSDNATKSQGFLQDIKNHIEGSAPNSKFRKYFPGWETDAHKGKWNESQIVISKRESSFKEPSIDTAGIETSKIGTHYDKIIFDDIVSDVNVTTKAQMDKVYDCYKKSLSLLKPGGDILLVGTVWHYGDTYNRIITENKERGNFDLFITSAEEIDKDGKLIYEDIGLDRKFLDYQKQEQGSYIYSCLYCNSAISDETALFKIENFNYYEAYPKFHEDMFITCTCDPAGEGEDFTAIIVCGIDKNKNIYVLEAVNDHLKPDKITDKIMTLNFKWKFDRFAVETNYFRGTLEQDLKLAMKEFDSNPNFKHFSIEPITASSSRRTFSKILGLQPYHERKQIYLPGKDFNSLSKVYSELAYQMIQFTIDGSKSPHDDLLCALSMQLDIISAGGEAKVKEPPETSAAWIEKQVITEMQGNRRKIPLRYRQTYEPVFYNN